jgi:hypothetical protein
LVELGAIDEGLFQEAEANACEEFSDWSMLVKGRGFFRTLSVFVGWDICNRGIFLILAGIFLIIVLLRLVA